MATCAALGRLTCSHVTTLLIAGPNTLASVNPNALVSAPNFVSASFAAAAPSAASLLNVKPSSSACLRISWIALLPPCIVCKSATPSVSNSFIAIRT